MPDQNVYFCVFFFFPISPHLLFKIGEESDYLRDLFYLNYIYEKCSLHESGSKRALLLMRGLWIWIIAWYWFNFQLLSKGTVRDKDIIFSVSANRIYSNLKTKLSEGDLDLHKRNRICSRIVWNFFYYISFPPLCAAFRQTSVQERLNPGFHH